MTTKQFPEGCKGSDIPKLKKIHEKCRRDNMDHNVSMSNDATLTWYRNNGFVETPPKREGGVYVFKLP